MYSSNTDSIDSIKLEVSTALQNTINSYIANNKNFKNLTDLFNQIQTDDTLLTEFIRTCNV